MTRPTTAPIPGQSPTVSNAADKGTGAELALPADADVVVRTPDFTAFDPTNGGPGLGSLDHLLGVTVTITAELGRVTRPIGDVLKFGVGAVVELSRGVSEPIELLVQGVAVARGEVVVVDDRFAVRITEIAESKRRLGS